MCGRFTQQRPTAELAELFGAEPLTDDPGGHFNLAPTDPASVVVERGDRRAITTYAWGLIQPWAKDPRVASRQINARAETVATSGAFRDSFRRRRCIVPVDGFYEWRRDGSARRPFLIRRDDGAPMALAGLWSGWRDPAIDAVRRTFTILTTTPNALIAPLHDRMPVILEPAGRSGSIRRLRMSASSTACFGRRPRIRSRSWPSATLSTTSATTGPS